MTKTSEKTEFSFPVLAFRKIPDPIDEAKYGRHYCVAKVSDIPMDLPKETNPRKQNLNTAVAKKIKAGLLGEDTGQIFHLLNRGLLISAESVFFDNRANQLTLKLPDHDKHGLVDGGHTYEIIKENLPNLPWDQFITIEIMTGIEDDFTSIAGARNTSVQVKDKSLAELEGKLNVIKSLVAGTPFEHDINYVEFDTKEIDVLDVIAVLTIFHNELNSNQNPVYCYSAKAQTLVKYLKNPQAYLKLGMISKDIFALHDHIKRSMKELYSKKTGGDFGKLKEIGYKNGHLKFPLKFSSRIDGEFEKLKYDIPSGFVYPILASLRFLLIENDQGFYNWRTDPFKFYDKKVGQDLINLTMEASKELGRNPMAVGKSVRHWNGLYNQVAATYLSSHQA